jgi:hypothetical protein
MMDAAARWPGVLVPGFEPLESRSLSADMKMSYMEAAFSLPRDAAAFPPWRAELLRCGVRQHPGLFEAFEDVESIGVVGFKMRPYVRDNTRHRETVWWSAEEYDWSAAQREAQRDSDMAPGMLGMDPLTVRSLLHRHNVTLVVVTRANSVKEALSWYRARELGLSQWNHEYHRMSRMGLPEVVPQTAQGQVPHHPAVQVDVHKFWEWLLFVESANKALEEAPAFFRRPVVNILYEDYNADYHAALQPLARLWGLDPGKTRVDTSFRKATAGQTLPDLVANFDELCRSLLGTRFFHFLEVPSCDSP